MAFAKSWLRRRPREWRPRRPLSKRSAKQEARLLAEGGLDQRSTFQARQEPMKAGRRKPALPAAKKLSLAKRSGAVCEIQLSVCTGAATDPSHRVGGKSGGRHGGAEEQHARLSNVLHSCRACHDWLHHHPAAAKAEHVGWMLEEWQEPTDWPVLYRGQMSWLTDDGRVVPYEEWVS